MHLHRVPLRTGQQPAARPGAALTARAGANPFSNGWEGVKRAANGVQQDAKRRFDEAKVGEKLSDAARVAGRKVRETASTGAEELNRSARRIENEYGVSDKAKGAWRKAKQAARDADNSMGISTKARAFRRDWPMYKHNISVFLSTPLGRFLTFGATIFIFVSGLWRPLLNCTIWLCFFGPIIFAPVLAAYARMKTDEEAARVAEAQRRRRNPAYNFTQTWREATQGVGASGRTRARKDSDDDEDGPIIDVEAETVDRKR
ncbi:unnamed protein product [Pedinophyceae sp. YPF-701]|nr:unnamed protein product [Pedinophyceae sp. YPF-701]